MHRRTFLGSLAFAVTVAAAPAPKAPPKKPKLVLAIVVDQFRYDYLTRFRAEYTSGFDRLLKQGAVFTNARYEHFPTVTAIGHSTVLSGATPSISGIIGNSWFDRESGKNVTSVEDEKTKLVGGRGGTGSSPHRMLVSTLADELYIASGGKSRSIGISLKDRSAILTVGHTAKAAFWLDNTTGNFVSSTFYGPELPSWAEDFNRSRPADKYAGAQWAGGAMTSDLKKLYADLAPSPFGNELIEAFAEHAIQGEQLGKREATDVLAVSFSCNDYIGHRKGPDSAEVHDISVRTDKLLGKLLQFVDAQVGLGNVVIVLTADHGVAPTPEANHARRMPGGRIARNTISSTVEKALSAKYGEGKWIANTAEHSLYLNYKLLEEKKIDPAEANRVAAAAALTVPHVFRVYTRERLMNGATLEDQVGRRVMNGFYVRRGADVSVLLEPYWIFEATGATHGTTFSYDAHVPIVFMGPGIKPGRYNHAAAPNDIAPTLATLLDVETPSGSVGRVLDEMLQ